MTKTNGKPIKAAFIIRMSKKEQEDSPDRQRENVYPICKNNGISIVKEYMDSGISGVKTSKRDGLKQMLADAKAGKFDVLVVDAVDRLSRLNSLDVSQITKPLADAGIRLFSVHEGWFDWSEFSDRIKFQFTTEMANQFLSGHAWRTLSGNLRIHRENRIVSGKPYALDRIYYDDSGEIQARVLWSESYQKAPGWKSRFAISEDTEAVEVVKTIFTSYVEELASISSIVVRLNKAGIPSPRGKVWTPGVVKYILSNHAYKGVAFYGRSSSGAFYNLDKSGNVVSGHGKMDTHHCTRRDDIPVVYHENAHEALIDPELFERAQKRLEERGYKRGPAVKKHCLTGILRCGICGARMHGISTEYDGKRYNTYRCSNQYKGLCPSGNSIRGPELENLLLRFALEHLDEEVESLTDSIKQQLKDGPQQQDQSQVIAKRIAKLDAEIKQGAKRILAVKNENLIAEMERGYAEMCQQREALKAELESLAATPKQKAIQAKEAIAELKTLSETFGKASPSKKHELFKRVFDRIEINFDETKTKGNRFSEGTVFFCINDDCPETHRPKT